MTAPDSSVSPGIGGFIAFFLLGCALWLLMRNMVGRLRNVDRRTALEDEGAEGGIGTEGTTGRTGRDEAMTTRPTSAADRVPGRAGPDEPPPAEASGPVDPDAERPGDRPATR